MSEDPSKAAVEQKPSETPSVEFQEREMKTRLSYKILTDQYKQLEEKSGLEKKELLEKTSLIEQKNQNLAKKFLEAELKAHAVAEGIKDIDFVKLIDTSEIKILEDGSIDGIEKALSDIKAKKPDWFGAEKKSSSSKGAVLPEQTKAPLVNALKMTDAEFRAGLTKKGIRI